MINPHRNIVPPEMAALLLPVPGTVKGYMFRRGGMELYHAKNGTMTVIRDEAYVYSWREAVQASRNSWSWGRKSHGTWVVAYR